VTTLGDILLRGVERFGPREALADPQMEVSYAELGSATFQLARGLQRIGLAPGDRSLVVLPNSVAFVRAHFANLLAGAISVPCDAAITPESLAGVCASCGPRLLLTDSASLARLTANAPLPAGLAHVVILDPPAKAILSGAPSPGGGVGVMVPVIDGTTLAAAEEMEPLRVSRRSDDLAALMYTTGTTGRPKGVMLSHANVLAALRSIIEFVHYTPEDREVVVLPLSHNFGLGHVYCNLMSGGAVYTENGLARVGRVVKALESFRATGFPGTPLGYGMLMDQYGPVLAQKGANLRFAVINSAPLSPERTTQLQALLPRLDIMVYYGLTEASRSAFISLSQSGPAYYRSVGRPMPHVDVRIRGGDGKDAAPDTSGEVVIRGPALAQGYWQNPEEESAGIRDGWLHTGDIGRIDADGYLWIVGRIKDVINVGGYKVLPGEVERVIAQFAGVRDVGVAGLEGLPGLSGETVVAGVVADEKFTLDEAALQQHCLAHLEKFKVPARFVRIAAVPRSNTGKTLRSELVSRLRESLAASIA